MPRCGTGDRVASVPSAVSVGPKSSGDFFSPLALCPSGDEGEQQEEKEKAKLEFTESPSVYLLFDSTFCLCAPSMDPPPPPSAPPPALPRPLSDSEGVPQNLLLLRGFSPFGLTLGSNPTDAPLTKRPFQRLPPPPPGAVIGWAMKVHLEHLSHQEAGEPIVCGGFIIALCVPFNRLGQRSTGPIHRQALSACTAAD